jgi:outer membrane protein assembly factor BamE (lipoprotein component of BamABCDE complex)
MTGRRTKGVRLIAGISAAMLVPVLAGCSPQIIKHGHQFRESDIQQIQVGMSQEQVKLQLGSPTTTATVNNGQAYYYISSTMKQAAFLKEKESAGNGGAGRQLRDEGRQGVRLHLAYYTGAWRARRRHRETVVPQPRHTPALRRIARDIRLTYLTLVHSNA